MNILTPIRDLINRLRRPKKPSGLPYGITRKQLSDLRTLIQTSEWETYTEVLDAVCKLKIEGALVSKEPVLWDRGFISGLRKAGLIADEIVRNEERERERRANNEQERADRADERRQLATFGTGYWRRGGGSNGRD